MKSSLLKKLPEKSSEILIYNVCNKIGSNYFDENHHLTGVFWEEGDSSVILYIIL